MNRAADAVAAKFAHHTESAPPHFALNGAADFCCMLSSPRCAQPLAKGTFCAVHELSRFPGKVVWRNFDAYGGVRVIAVFLGGQVELDEVTRAKHASAWNAVHHFVIHAEANIAGESINHRRRRSRSMHCEHLRADFRKLGGGHARTDFRGHRAQRFGNNDPAGFQLFKLLRAGDGHIFAPATSIRFTSIALRKMPRPAPVRSELRLKHYVARGATASSREIAP